MGVSEVDQRSHRCYLVIFCALLISSATSRKRFIKINNWMCILSRILGPRKKRASGGNFGILFSKIYINFARNSSVSPPIVAAALKTKNCGIITTNGCPVLIWKPLLFYTIYLYILIRPSILLDWLEITDSPHAVNWLAKFLIRLFTTNIIGTTGRCVADWRPVVLVVNGIRD